MTSPPFLTDLCLAEFVALAKKTGNKPFHGKMLHKWIFRRLVLDLEQMTDLPREFREGLRKTYSACRLSVAAREQSSDGTEKILFRLNDGLFIETVKIPEGKRLTLCLSTQVGCAVGCRFCASGSKGLERNLLPGEIVEQILHAVPGRREDLTNLVFMGIGEPLMNFEALSRSIAMINSPEGLGLGARRITVSTVGLPEGIRKLADLELQINLAISLHAADPEKRRTLIPIAASIPMESILEAGDYYRRQTTRDVTYEVLLLKDVNDTQEDATKLADLLKGRKGLVNLIPFNGVASLPFKSPSKKRVDQFKESLEEAGIPVTVRRARGTDIRAACGQLRMKNME